MTNPESPPSGGTTGVTESDTIVSAISRQLGPETDPSVVAAVLKTWNDLKQGDPPGTIRRQATSGFVGHRIVKDGVHMWFVTEPDGGSWYDTQPALPGWDVVFRPDQPESEQLG